MSLVDTLSELRSLSQRLLRPARILSLRHKRSLDAALSLMRGCLVKIYNPDLVLIGVLGDSWCRSDEPYLYRVNMSNVVMVDMRNGLDVSSVAGLSIELPIERLFISPDLADAYDQFARVCVRPVLSRSNVLTERVRKIVEETSETRLNHLLRMWLLEWRDIERDMREIYRIMEVPDTLQL